MKENNTFKLSAKGRKASLNLATFHASALSEACGSQKVIKAINLAKRKVKRKRKRAKYSVTYKNVTVSIAPVPREKSIYSRIYFLGDEFAFSASALDLKDGKAKAESTFLRWVKRRERGLFPVLRFKFYWQFQAGVWTFTARETSGRLLPSEQPVYAG